MRIVSIADASPEAMKPYLDLTDVALRSRVEPAAGIYIAESAKVIRRALTAGHEPVSIITEEKWLSTISDSIANFDDVEVYVGTPAELEAITGFNVHRGAIAAMRRPPLRTMHALIADAKRVIVLDDIADHTNVGAAFRAVAGLGADAVLVSPRCSDPLYRRSVRVSMGTVLQVPWTRMPEWPEARELFTAAGFEVAAFALSPDAISLDDYVQRAPEKLAIVLGSEGHGLGAAALEAADVRVKIPMSHGVDSLNVASACAVAVWALRPAVHSATASSSDA